MKKNFYFIFVTLILFSCIFTFKPKENTQTLYSEKVTRLPTEKKYSRTIASVSASKETIHREHTEKIILKKTNNERLENAYLDLFERLKNRDNASKKLVTEILKAIKESDGKILSISNHPVSRKGIYILTKNYLEESIPNSDFREKWIKFLDLIAMDRKERELAVSTKH